MAKSEKTKVKSVYYDNVNALSGGRGCRGRGEAKGGEQGRAKSGKGGQYER